MASNLKFLAKVGCHNSVNALMCRFAGNQVSSWHLKKILRKLAWPVAQLSGWHAQIVRWTPDASGSTSMAEKWRFWVVPWCLKFSHLGHNCACRSGLTIFYPRWNKYGKGIGPCRWFATQTLVRERKAWSMSLWQLTWTSSKKLISNLVFEHGKRMVRLSFAQLHWQVPYHSIQLERRERKRRAVKHAADAEVEVWKGFPHAVCQGMRMMQPIDIVKRFLRNPNKGNLDPQMHFSIKVLPIAHMQTMANMRRKNMHTVTHARKQ